MSFFWSNYPCYLLSWIKERKPEISIDNVRVHELRIPLNDEIALEGSTQNLTRVIFVQYCQQFVFGMFCDEYGSHDPPVAYVAYLARNETAYVSEGNTPSFMKCVVGAYAEYISLIAKGRWQFYIWADPPKDGKPYIFRGTRMGSQGEFDVTRLRQGYAKVLQDSGFSGKPYVWLPTLPPLPPFGKKNEDEVKRNFGALVSTMEVAVTGFNALFENTHCVELIPRISEPIKTQVAKGSNPPIRSDWTAEALVADTELNFDTVASSIDSTRILIRRMSAYGPRNTNKMTYYSDYKMAKLKIPTRNSYKKILKHFVPGNQSVQASSRE